MKVKREEAGFAPRSLFNRMSPAALKVRRDLRLQQRRTIFSPGTLSLPSAKPALLANKASLDENAPEWLVHEDWALLQVRERSANHAAAVHIQDDIKGRN